jgi:hypothetical protein
MPTDEHLPGSVHALFDDLDIAAASPAAASRRDGMDAHAVNSGESWARGGRKQCHQKKRGDRE